MDYTNLVKQIVELDPKISNAIVIDDDGNIVSVTPDSKRSLTDSESALELFEISLTMKMARGREQDLGKLNHIQITHENIIELVFPLPREHILLVSYRTKELAKEMSNIIVRLLNTKNRFATTERMS